MGIQNSSAAPVDDTLNRLVTMVYQTNLVALDKTLTVIRQIEKSCFATAAQRAGSIADRMARAREEVRGTIDAARANNNG